MICQLKRDHPQPLASVAAPPQMPAVLIAVVSYNRHDSAAQLPFLATGLHRYDSTLYLL